MPDPAPPIGEWHPFGNQPRDGRQCLFFGRGNRNAGNENARSDYFRVDQFSERWPNGKYQYPEAPYTHWMPLPEKPNA